MAKLVYTCPTANIPVIRRLEGEDEAVAALSADRVAIPCSLCGMLHTAKVHKARTRNRAELLLKGSGLVPQFNVAHAR